MLGIVNKPKQRGFKTVTGKDSHTLPRRAEPQSAGYDFVMPKKVQILPNETVRIYTGIKAYMQPNEYLSLYIRSSLGGIKEEKQLRIANVVGIVDAGYYDNPDNEGEISVFITNEGRNTVMLDEGDRFCQGIFIQYFLTDDDKPISDSRTGGHGSTGV